MTTWPQLRFGICAAATAGYWIVFALLLHLPPQDLPEEPALRAVPFLEEMLHGGLYGVLTALIAATAAAYRTRRGGAADVFPAATALRIFGCVTVYGALDELTQPLTGRKCELVDFVTDVVASAIVLGAARLIARRFAR